MNRPDRHRFEADFQADVIDMARTLGCLAYHTHNSRRSEPGFPDLVIVGKGGVLFRELKTAKGKVAPAQEKWLAALGRAGADATVWRPDDWPHAIREQITAISRTRQETTR